MSNESSSKRYSIHLFVVLAFLIAAPVLILRFVDLPSEPILIYASWTPNIAAILVLVLYERKKGSVRELLAGWGKWKVGGRWYLAAFSPLLVGLLASLIALLFGGETSDPVQPLWLATLITFLISTFTGALGEELGWRGFLLPRLQRRFGALASGLIVGVIWALWHAPLWLLPGQGWDTTPYGAFAVYIISASVLLTWINNNTGGSLVMASIFHFSINFALSMLTILGLMPNVDDYWKYTPYLYAAYALIVVLVAGSAKLSRKDATA